MKIVERATVILFILVLIVFATSRVYLRVAADTTPPEISCQSDELRISVSATRQQMLQGVSARDNRDGDLTDRIIIQGVTPLLSDSTAKVTYVVFDAANNMATCQRTIRYTDYEKPHFTLSAPLIYPVGAEINLLDRLRAADAAGEDISASIRVTAQNVSANYEGAYRVTVQATNALGDTETLTLPLVIDNEAAEHAQIVLSDYIVYLAQGDAFHSADYIVSVSEKDGTEGYPSLVKTQGKVDSAVPGVYEVTYTYQSYTVSQTVVVK